MVDNRFLHPYYVLNVALVLAYVGLRAKRLDPHELSKEDMFGITREAQIYFCLFLMMATRTLSAPTLDAYLSSAFMFLRVAIVVLLWHMDKQLVAVFLALWTMIYAVCPQPRYKLPKSIVTLNNVTYNDRIARNKHKTIYVLWCHATWSARCSQLAPVLASLAKAYDHPRVRFARVDVSKYPTLADTLSVSVSPASKQLPTVICYKQGQEVARIPVMDQRGNLPKQWSRGFKAAHVAEALNLNTHFITAKQWEQEAQQRLRQSDKKTN
ncbi:Thioredoxin-related transmembrane protein 2-like [Gracilariopsis chorda]|uniref:Thioredoxin-related transmembrane protein 2-like n=1 Tax=Gracilariopsis chorda TaxID=448386 RepID=A0A2V3JAE5_9FLOR|nr:Thioredoxin-related transmembrane protein 2-like [Gracilariopsis chorda]|eukprot:PXF49680.1 Thioredoxin-related transmembrane protein 2-like [Gracilariopsis chorda]